MKKFIFNLQRILTLKEKKEELLKQELNRLFFKKKQHEHVKAHFEKTLETEYQKRREIKSIKAEEHELLENYHFSIRNNIYNQTLMINEYELKIEAKRKELLENRREIKTLEKLKEKQKEQYAYDLMQEERKTMDEVANRLSFVKT